MATLIMLSVIALFFTRFYSCSSFADADKVAINGNHPVVDKVLKAESEEEKIKIAKQSSDLALFSQGLLTGKELTAFVKRSVELL